MREQGIGATSARCLGGSGGSASAAQVAPVARYRIQAPQSADGKQRYVKTIPSRKRELIAKAQSNE
eukprot:7067853-Pyramimonas_sp.AAC.1